MSIHGSTLNKLFFSVLFCLFAQNRALATDPNYVMRCFQPPEASPAQAFNNFCVRDLSKKVEHRTTIRNATALVSLITPLNSVLAKEGDVVQAEVISSADSHGRAWLPQGTIFSGCVERANKATFGRTDGAILLRFYSARINGRDFEISNAPNTADSTLHPAGKPATVKSTVRNALMAASFIAIPAAIGSGGLSVALTTGSGALIGGLLADDGKHIQGAFQGAWEGSGLGILDPVVRKGANVALPVGTKIQLQQCDPIQLPDSVVRLAISQQRDEGSPPPAQLETAARIVPPTDIGLLGQRCQKLLDQHDLAAALGLLDKELAKTPDNETIKEMKQRLLDGVTDGPAVTIGSTNKEEGLTP